MKRILSFILLFLVCIYAHAQERTVTGVITSGSDNQPLIGVSIIIKGTTNGTLTDIDGRYTIKVPDENTVLVFSYVGYNKEEIAVSGKSVIDVKLAEDLTKLDEIVVVGYGVQKKSLVTGAISKITGDDLTQSSNLRASQVLQGKVAGAVITNNSGQPGSGVSVRIRGIGTNGNADPLYIIDGLPTSDAGLDFLNPSDIESIEVLKDAASSSIYGTRGANGVVLVTTKKGKEGSKQVTYDGYYGLQNPWRKLDILNSKEYMTLINEAAANANKPAIFSTAFIAKNAYNTDWQDEMFNYNAPIQNHVLSISGGDEKSTYSSSLSYFGQDGIVAKDNSNFQRIAFRLNATRKLGFLEMGSILNFANITNKGIDANNQYGGSSLIQALNTPPIVPVKNPDGSWGTPSQASIGLGMQEITNPVAMLSYLNSKTNTNKAVGNVYGDFDFGKIASVLKGLKFRTSVSIEYSFVNGRGYTPQYYLDATHQTTVNGVNENIDKYNTFNIDNTLAYDKSIRDHHFSVMLGQSSFDYKHTNVSGSRNQVIFNDLDHAYLDNAQATNASAGGGYQENTLASYFGRLNYDYNNKYLLTAIVRRDGSSRFGSNNKYGTFPSVSMGWVISREDFMKNIESVISFVKLRGSWGQNGSQEIGDFKYTSTISTGSIYYFGSDKTQYNGAQPSVIANPNLKWEKSEQIDLGLDLNLYRNKINVTLDYYKKTTKDWLLQAPAPSMIGNVPPTVNGGNIQNNGFEFQVGYQNDFNKFHFEASILGGFNKNKVTDIPNLDKKLTGGNGGFGQGGIVVFKVDESAGSFYGVKTDGLFQNKAEINTYTHTNADGTSSLIQPNAQPGDVKFVDQNNDGKIDDKDRVNLGSPFPDFTGGINIKMSFKGFDFNAFLYASLGNKIWDATRRYDINYANYRSDALNRWIGEGSSNSFPRVTLNDANGNWSTASDMFVKDGSFMRLRNITLGYTIPTKISQFIKIKRFRIYLSAENLLTFTKYKGFDPEIGGGIFSNGIDYGNYPQARTILGGVNISF
jgi:TonB-linked SusC/RagA family outer membrane protein